MIGIISNVNGGPCVRDSTAPMLLCNVKSKTKYAKCTTYCGHKYSRNERHALCITLINFNYKRSIIFHSVHCISHELYGTIIVFCVYNACSLLQLRSY